MSNKIKYNQYSWALCNTKIIRGKVEAIDIIAGLPRYWLSGYLGYFHASDLFDTKLKALEALYRRLNEIDLYAPVPEWDAMVKD